MLLFFSTLVTVFTVRVGEHNFNYYYFYYYYCCCCCCSGQTGNILSRPL